MAKKSEPTANDELLEALESIKGLLEKSEGKLSAARESLARAKSSNRRSPDKPRIPISSEPVVPVLDEVVATLDEDEQNIPVLESAIAGEPLQASEAAPLTPGPAAHSTGQVIDYLDDLREGLEKAVHEGLINACAATIPEHPTANIKKRIETGTFRSASPVGDIEAMPTCLSSGGRCPFARRPQSIWAFASSPGLGRPAMRQRFRQPPNSPFTASRSVPSCRQMIRIGGMAPVRSTRERTK